MNTHFEVIQYLIDRFNYKSYLEIGVRQNGDKLSIEHIKCELKDGVDIANRGQKYQMTSNEFFKKTELTQKYDIIFIDGDHEKNQVYTDIINSLNHLNESGTIVCHDINPQNERLLAPRYCNNSWETFAKLRSEREDLEMYALAIEAPGVGVIRKGTQKIYNKPVEHTWEFLNNNRTELLNVVDTETFKKLLK